MVHLHCQLCTWRINGSDVSLVTAAYMFHCIRDHWDMIEQCHNNPELLDKAMTLVVMATRG